MTNDPFKFQELATSAGGFCQLIERLGKPDEGEWLHPVRRSLARLHGALLQFDSSGIDYRFFPLPDFDDRFELFCRLKRFFKEQDSYFLDEADTDRATLSGSLADDFTDIYFELKRGLKLLDSGIIYCEEEALKLWQSGFMLHWGQHLVDAERHLYQLGTEEIYLITPAVRAR